MSMLAVNRKCASVSVAEDGEQDRGRDQESEYRLPKLVHETRIIRREYWTEVLNL